MAIYGAVPVPGELPVQNEDKPGCMQCLYPSGFMEELKGVLKIAGPMILTQLCQYMIGPIAIVFCGHLGEIELAAVALATSFINITGITIALGLSCACDTLFAQVYGSKNRKRLGIMLQRSLLILLLAVFPCWAIHLNMEALLRLLGQDPEVSRRTADYLLLFMPGVLFFFIYVCLSKYLQNQNIVMPNLIIGGVSNAVNALLHYLLVFITGLGIEGSAISQALTYFTMMLLTLLYIFIMKVYEETWDGWSLECLRDWGEFLRLAAFGLIMLCTEYWTFEIGTIAAGLLGTDYLGSMSVIYQLEIFAYMLPLGSGIAASIRVGQYLGAGDAAGAQTAARVTMTAICIAEVGVATLFLTLHNYLPMIFTDVPGVIDLVRNVLIVCALYQISDGLAGTGAGILRGQGQQKLGALIVFCGYAVALGGGIPLMLYSSLRLYAFWGGFAISLTIEGICFALIIHFSDWEGQALQAQVRAKVIPESQAFDVSSEKLEKLSLVQSNGSTSRDDLINKSTEGKLSLTEEIPIKTIIVQRIVASMVIISIFVGGILLRLLYTNNIELPIGVSLNMTTTRNSNTSWTPDAM